MKIGLMGGTFNPIHQGHLIISEYIRVRFPLDKIIFIPSGTPPHKEELKTVSAEHRYNMVSLAIETNPYFNISSVEVNRKGKSYTVDTITELKKLYPMEDLYFIVGADTIYEFTKWKDYENLLRMTKFIVIGRYGLNVENNIEKIKELNQKYNAQILYMNGPLVDISSTDIRNRISEKESIKYIVPEKVEEYINENRLYVSEGSYGGLD